MLKRPCFVCGKPTRASMCEECLKLRPAQKRKTTPNRPSRQARGYDSEYEQNRALMVQEAKAHHWPCQICHKPFEPGQTITAEHKIPKRRGGTNARENLVPAHSWCNSGWRRRSQ